MYDRPTIGLDEARAALDAVLARATGEPARPVAVFVVDPDGEIVAAARMDRTGHLPRDMALRKAYTAARLGADTDRIVQNLRSAGVEIAELGDPRFVGIAGGVAIRIGAHVVGAVGVSGRSAEEDEALARAGVASLDL